MKRPRPNLPDFTNPPVVEVYISAQFEPIEGFDAGCVLASWEQFSSEFPGAKFQPPLVHEVEQFGGSPEQFGMPQVQFVRSPDMQVRLALTSQDGARLIQIQSDRFVHNWRKAAPDATYPRYEEIRERFEAYFEAFRRGLAARGLKSPMIDQCEVCYINHIRVSEGLRTFADAAQAFRQLQHIPETDSLPPLEDVGVRARYMLTDAQNAPSGRLHTLMQPGLVTGPEDSAFMFTLLVRGRPSDMTLNSALDFCDMGRETIVRAFAALTTPEMHKVWGRTDDA